MTIKLKPAFDWLTLYSYSAVTHPLIALLDLSHFFQALFFFTLVSSLRIKVQLRAGSNEEGC